MRVVIQAGHSAAFPPYRSGGGGAPQEAAWTADLATRIAAHLRTAGATVDLVGSWLSGQTEYAPPAAMRQDADLFASLHYDADIYPDRTGCFADRWEYDAAHVAAKSAHALATWEALYPAATGIPLRNHRRNVNTYRYYAFRAKTANTPGLLIEHGVGQGLDRARLFDGIESIAAIDATAILTHLGIQEQEAPMLTDAERTILDAAARQTAAGNTIANGGDLDWWIGTWHQLDADKRDLARQLTVSQGETAARDARIAELEAQLASVQPATVERVEVELTGGRVQVLSRN